MTEAVDDNEDSEVRRRVSVDGFVRCPEHGRLVVVLSVKTLEGASPRYMLACPEPTCARMLLIIAKTVKETTLLAIDGKSIGTIE